MSEKKISNSLIKIAHLSSLSVMTLYSSSLTAISKQNKMKKRETSQREHLFLTIGGPKTKRLSLLPVIESRLPTGKALTAIILFSSVEAISCNCFC